MIDSKKIANKKFEAIFDPAFFNQKWCKVPSSSFLQSSVSGQKSLILVVRQKNIALIFSCNL